MTDPVEPEIEEQENEEPKFIQNAKGEKFRVEKVVCQTKRKQHPREHLYERGKTGYEYNKAMMEFMGRINEEQMDQLSKNELVLNEQSTREWIQATKKGDLVGVVAKRYTIESVTPFGILAKEGSDLKDHGGKLGEQKIFTIPELDFAREIGLLDILWRDGKPFGVSETEDYKVIILHPVDENGNDIPDAPTTQLTDHK